MFTGVSHLLMRVNHFAACREVYVGKLGLKDVAEKLRLKAIREDRSRMAELSQERLRRYNMNDARITYLIGMRALKSMLA